MIQPTIEKILEVMATKKYRVYDTPSVDWNLNIIGVRNKALQPHKFDDTLILFHRFLGNWSISYYPITTDPSMHYLLHPVNPKGTAILEENQYVNAYAIDKHNGKYEAFCQRLKSVTVFRDKDKDGDLELEAKQRDTGMFGINIHKGPLNGDWDSANSIYSAGCQVFADSRQFAEFMLKCRNARNDFGNKFTYTLLNERDFI